MVVICHAGPAISEPLEDRLRGLGYENVAVEAHGDSMLVVWCENRRARYVPEWILHALYVSAKNARESFGDQARVRLIAQKFAQPVVLLEASAGAVVRWMNGRLSSEMFRDSLDVRFSGGSRAVRRTNSSLRRVDMAVGPGRLLYELNVPNSFLNMQLDVSGEFSTALAPGLDAYGRFFVPLHRIGDRSSSDYRYGEIRPGSMMLSYFRSLGSPSAFATVTVGAFELGNSLHDSYGAVIDVHQFSTDGVWSIGGQVGYLGYLTYEVSNGQFGHRRIWRIGNEAPDRVPYSGMVTYRFSSADLIITARWGRFLGGDRGWRMDIDRRFGEIGLAIFGIKSDGRYWDADRVDRENVRLLGGVRIRIPLGPRRNGMPDRFRVRSTDFLEWYYRYRPGNVGIDVATKHQVSDLVDGYYPTTIENNLGRVRKLLKSSILGRREELGSTNR